MRLSLGGHQPLLKHEHVRRRCPRHLWEAKTTSALTDRVPERRRRGVRIYLPVAAMCAAIALIGFWPTYFGPLLSGTVQALPIIHLHAAVFSGWLLLVIAQVGLAATGRTALHMRVGKLGMAYGVLLIVVGEVTAFSAFGARVAAGEIEEAHRRLFAPVTDLIVFAPFLAAAWIYRRSPEVHKRLIVVATTILLIAAVHRTTIFGGPPPPLLPLLLIWLAPIGLGIASDFAKRRSVHPVYIFGVAAVLFLKFGRRPLAQTEVWKELVNWLTSFYV